MRESFFPKLKAKFGRRENPLEIQRVLDSLKSTLILETLFL